jgi:flagellar motor switch protein FliN
MSSSPISSSSSETGPVLPGPLMPFANVPCQLDIVLGDGAMTLRACLELQRGSIVRLTQSAGQDLTLLVNGVHLGRGEVVVIDHSVSLRVTELRRVRKAAR